METRFAFVMLIISISLVFGCFEQKEEKDSMIEKRLEKEEIESALRLLQVDMSTAMNATKPFECKNPDQKNGVVIWIWPKETIRIWAGKENVHTMDTIMTDSRQFTKDKRYLKTVYDPKMFDNCDWFLIEYQEIGQKMDIETDIYAVTQEYEDSGFRCTVKDLKKDDFEVGKNQVVCDITPELLRWTKRE